MLGDVGERFVMDFDAWTLEPEAFCRGLRGTADWVLFECWSSGANRVLCCLELAGDCVLVSLVTIPACLDAAF